MIGGMAALLSSLLLLLPPWYAQASDLEDYLAAAEEAEFSGRQVVVCWAPGGPVADTYRVGQRGGRLWVAHGTEEAMVTDGELLDRGSGEGWQRTRAPVAPTTVRLADRYRHAERTEVRFGRPAVVFEVMEGALVRARFVFDRTSSAPLMTEVFDGEGSLFRMSALIDFTPGGPEMSEPAARNRTELSPAEPSPVLVAEVAGYRRAGVYRGPGDGIQAYYSDGLFSFSVFEVPGSIEPDSLEGADEIELAGSLYRVRFLPSELWVLWSAGGRSYLLVGDLPPDHLEAVLEQLPEPDPPGLLSRLWRMLLGR